MEEENDRLGFLMFIAIKHPDEYRKWAMEYAKLKERLNLKGED